jgi:hypothetical protein
MLAMMPPDLITVFRVFASGEAQTFDDMDSAVAYLKSQAEHSEALLYSPLTLESAKVTIEQYRYEVDRQEACA